MSVSDIVGGLPWCAVCRKPVDRMTEYCDPSKGTYTFVAHCHGEHERVELEEEFLESVPRWALRFAAAFETKRLPAGSDGR